MQVLHDRFANDSRVSVLAVHVDDSGDPVAYLEEHGYTFPTIPSGADVAREFKIGMLPTFVVVGPDGAVLHKHVGRLTDQARDEIERIARDAR